MRLVGHGGARGRQAHGGDRLLQVVVVRRPSALADWIERRGRVALRDHRRRGATCAAARGSAARHDDRRHDGDRRHQDGAPHDPGPGRDAAAGRRPAALAGDTLPGAEAPRLVLVRALLLPLAHGSAL